MNKQIIWSPSSEKDFEDILDYLSRKWSKNVAYQFIIKTEILLNQIANNPKQFPIINKQLKVRKCVLTKHNSLYYKITTNHIEIIRIYDTRQNPNDLILK
ncbi:type II toxin-antitoxin system RelE/ParE family toxin [Plebeiibacterium sediminum]|uniref:Type II toxin-antitoxin system RelE/ParE family toxin n=1 Tax=Plebeiibacterium sediminum TaxID=2992112 RepID=A0AAE3SGX2_9BACT|nr:type II toxin-antitoxin system RelE/ParE family toxin [Plebeiobacterium sediminum]MCW3787743.1 type II toxin-antitoxin system RelE/ParE family toxin [Plebeiobacterium sediminum]